MSVDPGIAVKTLWSNATVMWSEREIVARECLIANIFQIVSETWSEINPAIRFARVETPVLTPQKALAGHVGTGFPMLAAGARGLLRPETTAGCVAAFEAMFPMESQRRKRLPFCVWQAGKSFRDESNPETMRASKLRLVEFWQLEFELFAAADTKADYIGPAVDALVRAYGGESVRADELPHYSRRTVDWEIGGLEVAGCSERTDWPGGIIHEVSIGLDRLLAVRS